MDLLKIAKGLAREQEKTCYRSSHNEADFFSYLLKYNMTEPLRDLLKPSIFL